MFLNLVGTSRTIVFFCGGGWLALEAAAVTDKFGGFLGMKPPSFSERAESSVSFAFWGRVVVVGKNEGVGEKLDLSRSSFSLKNVKNVLQAWIACGRGAYREVMLLVGLEAFLTGDFHGKVVFDSLRVLEGGQEAARVRVDHRQIHLFLVSTIQRKTMCNVVHRVIEVLEVVIKGTLLEEVVMSMVEEAKCRSVIIAGFDFSSFFLRGPAFGWVPQRNMQSLQR
jgi:hypothetical protein